MQEKEIEQTNIWNQEREREREWVRNRGIWKRIYKESRKPKAPVQFPKNFENNWSENHESNTHTHTSIAKYRLRWVIKNKMFSNLHKNDIRLMIIRVLVSFFYVLIGTIITMWYILLGLTFDLVEWKRWKNKKDISWTYMMVVVVVMVVLLNWFYIWLDLRAISVFV